MNQTAPNRQPYSVDVINGHMMIVAMMKTNEGRELTPWNITVLVYSYNTPTGRRCAKLPEENSDYLDLFSDVKNALEMYEAIPSKQKLKSLSEIFITKFTHECAENSWPSLYFDQQ